MRQRARKRWCLRAERKRVACTRALWLSTKKSRRHLVLSVPCYPEVYFSVDDFDEAFGDMVGGLRAVNVRGLGFGLRWGSWVRVGIKRGWVGLGGGWVRHRLDQY